MSEAADPFLSGMFEPVRTEDDFELEIVGEFPRELAGTYLRNGPNPQFAPKPPYHPFTGDGMLHGFAIADGKVKYRNRYVQTPRWQAERAAGHALFGAMGDPRTTDPSVLNIDPGVAATNIVWHGGHLLALQESSPPFEVNPDSLEPIGYRNDYLGKVTAHPKIDPETSELVWFAHNVGPIPISSTMSYGVTAPDGTLARRDDFTAPYASLAHDFLVTKQYVLFPVLPIAGSIARAMAGGPAFAWEPDLGVHVGVMRRDASVDTMRWFETDARHFYHPLNAWEEGNVIHADLMEFARAPLIPDPDGSPGADVPARLVRWSFDLSDNTNAIQITVLDDLNGELPRPDERYAGRPYRHGWYAAAQRHGMPAEFDTIAHLDLKTGKRALHQLQEGGTVGEPLFIPRSDSADEGDGWIVAVARRGKDQLGELLVFNALDVGAGPIGLARAPRIIPMGFHGNWIAAR
jgi:carotenoid cleavage dioxygenase